MTVTVSGYISPTKSTNILTYVSHLTGVDISLSRLANFDDVFNAHMEAEPGGFGVNQKPYDFNGFLTHIWYHLSGIANPIVLEAFRLDEKYWALEDVSHNLE